MERGTKLISGVVGLFCFLIRVLVTYVYTFAKIHQTVLLRSATWMKEKMIRHIGPQKQECFLKKCPELVKPYCLLHASPVHLFKTNLEKQ